MSTSFPVVLLVFVLNVLFILSSGQETQTESTSCETNSSSTTQMAGAVYFMTNDPRGNFIISNMIQPDGQLKFYKAYSTQGFGGCTFTSGSTSCGIDPLKSQNAITVMDRNLFAVNPGSNTVAMFEINTTNPAELNHLTTVWSGGDFPIALAYSQRFKMLCVLNTGINNCVQCYRVEAITLERLSMAFQPIGLQQTTPPNSFGSASDIIFSQDSSQLFVAVKENMALNLSAFILSFHVQLDQIGNPVKSVPHGIRRPFGMSIVPTATTNTTAIVFSDPLGPGYGISIFSDTGAVQNTVLVSIDRQIATCWTVFSPRTQSLFTTDTATRNVTESAIIIANSGMEIEGKILGQIQLEGLPTDVAIISLGDKELLYALTPNVRGIHVLSVEKPGEMKIIQKFALTEDIVGVPLVAGLSGMAAYLAHPA